MKIKSNPDECKICGCTENDACFHPYFGACWWTDPQQTLCSHCADKRIFDDPLTIHGKKLAH